MEETEQNKELIIRLLEKDIMAYRNFIPIIRSMSQEAFNNFFEGIKSYPYNVPKKHKFLLLVEKVDNYKFILDWGYEEAYYPYLEEMWINYVCMEDLKNTSETEICNFLESNNIHYSKWPSYIQDELKRCIKHTDETIVFKCKKKYQSLKGIRKYCLDKVKAFIKFLKELKYDDVRSLVEKFHLDLIGKILLGGGGIGITSYKLIFDNVIEEKIEGLFTKETFTYFWKNFGDLVQTKSFLMVESFITVANLIFAIRDFHKISEIANKCEDFKDRLDSIKQSFKIHITNANYDNVFEKGCDLNIIFRKILNDVNSDLTELKILINDINLAIKDCQEKKKESGIGIATSAIFAIGSGIAAIATGGASIPATVISTICSTGNIASGTIFIIDLVKCCKVADELNEILKEALKTKDEIQSEIEKLSQKISELSNFMKCLPKYRYF